MPHTLSELTQVIQAHFAAMSPQFQLVARFLIEHPTKVPLHSARQLAEQLGIQPSTLVRFAQSLGFSGWNSIKAVFTANLQNMTLAYTQRAQNLVNHPSPAPTTWQNAIAKHQQNMQALAELNQQRLAPAVDLLVNAKRIITAGYRSCYPAAFNLAYLCNLFRSDVHTLHNIGTTMEANLQHLRDGDVVVIISYQPYSREAVEMAQVAHDKACQVLAISDSLLAPIALNAHHVLLFPTQGDSFFPSTVALQTLIEMLAQRLLIAGGEKSIQTLKRTEAILHTSHAYVQGS